MVFRGNAQTYEIHQILFRSGVMNKCRNREKLKKIDAESAYLPDIKHASHIALTAFACKEGEKNHL